MVGDAARTGIARTFDGTGVAYQVFGEGPVDVLVSRATYFPVDMMCYEPRLVRFLDRMSSFSRHIWFDPRGTGSSDRIHHEESRLLESVVDDMVAVLDALNCERVALLGLGVPVPLLFAATHPERTSALVVADSSPRVRRAADYPIGIRDEIVDQRVDDASTGVSLQDRIAPSLLLDAEFSRWFRHAERLTAPPAERLSRARGTFAGDLRPVLDAVRVPTLVINHLDRGRDRLPAQQTQYIVDHVAGASPSTCPDLTTCPSRRTASPWLIPSKSF